MAENLEFGKKLRFDDHTTPPPLDLNWEQIRNVQNIEIAAPPLALEIIYQSYMYQMFPKAHKISHPYICN